MGRKTWESIPEKFRPLEGRHNIVLTKAATLPESDPERGSYPAGVVLASSMADALHRAADLQAGPEVFVIGGETAYKEAISMPTCKRVYLTRVAKNFEVDAFFPAIDEEQFAVTRMSKTWSHNEIPFDFVVYERKPLSTEAAGISSLLSASLAAVG
eukprot:1525099-Amphidinium_carterae.1